MSGITENSSPKTDPRLLHLDIIRGVALLGILLINFKAFVNPVTHDLLHGTLPKDPLNYGVEVFLRTFFEGKFYIIYSLLFGASFALLFEKAQAKGLNYNRIVIRRIFSLAIIGVAHSIFAWEGDILFLYALTGALVFTFFRKTPTSRLPKWGLGFIVFPIAIALACTLILRFDSNMKHPIAEGTAVTSGLHDGEALSRLAASDAAQRQASYRGLVKNNFQVWHDQLETKLATSLFIISYFLFGFWLMRSGRFTHVDAHRKSWERFIFWGLTLGLPIAFAGAFMPKDVYIPEWIGLANLINLLLGALLLALAYIGLISLYGSRFRIMRWLAPAGRMSLTNYLSQSVIWTVICYGYGFGLAPYLQARAVQVPLALTFFALQVQWSHWWLARYEHGPVEYLWRWFTYFEKPAFLRKAPEVNRISFNQPDSLPQ